MLGRYVLYGQIASGGMATVHYGRLLGVVGFSRTVAIKRLHPQFATDPEFVSMFLDEARLAARIRHPNVVSTIDVVATEGEVFLVMEYVQGVSLSLLVKGAMEERTRIPTGIAVSIAADMLHGLHAAHEAASEQGEPLHLVHRDVSPQNVLVGIDGTARVLDFGVAKAIGRLQTTRDGQVKGKLAYMAPEHVTGREVTRACDIFAASVVLWEILTGKRLFGGGDDGQTVYKILHASIEPPSEHVPELPAALDQVVLRGLSRVPGDRFPTAKEMARALEASYPLATASEVGDYVESAASTLLDTRARELAAIESDVSPTGPEAGATTAAERTAEPTVPENVVFVERDARAPRRWRLGALLLIVAVAAGGSALLIARRGGGAPVGSSSSSASSAPSTSSSSASLSFVIPSAAVSSSAEPPASALPTGHRGTRPPVHGPAGGACDPPFTIDSAGYRHYKRECVR